MALFLERRCERAVGETNLVGVRALELEQRREELVALAHLANEQSVLSLLGCIEAVHIW